MVEPLEVADIENVVLTRRDGLETAPHGLIHENAKRSECVKLTIGGQIEATEKYRTEDTFQNLHGNFLHP